MTENKRRGSRFAKGLLIYILIFLLLAAAALAALGMYLRAYEASRPYNCVGSYISKSVSGKLGSGWDPCLDSLDERIQSEKDGRAFIKALLQDAEYRELQSEWSGKKLYGLFDPDGVCFERLTLRQTGETHWGFTSWVVDKEDCDLSAYTKQFSLTVPTEYSVWVDDMTLDERFITESDIPYATLADCGALVEELPTMVHYEGGPYLTGSPALVRDTAGKEVPEGKLNELAFLANCSREDQQRLEEFSLTYLDLYLSYAGDEGGSWFYYWGLLYPMIVRHGELEDRLILAREGFGFNNTHSVEIVSHNINVCTDLKDGHYLVDIDYRTETVGLHGPVQEDNRVRLLILEEKEQLYAEAMYHY